VNTKPKQPRAWIETAANVIKLFTDVISLLSAYLSQNHREIHREWRYYGRKKLWLETFEIFASSHHVACFTLEVKSSKGRTIPGANVIKLFTMVIYCHSMVIPSFCVTKLYYLGNYHGMAVNYHGIKLFYNIGQKSVL
jgi:hypothetical protein